MKKVLLPFDFIMMLFYAFPELIYSENQVDLQTSEKTESMFYLLAFLRINFLTVELGEKNFSFCFSGYFKESDYPAATLRHHLCFRHTRNEPVFLFRTNNIM